MSVFKLSSYDISRFIHPDYNYDYDWDVSPANMFKSVVDELKFVQEVNAVLKIKKVIFNNPATIVYWLDGSKTVVKCLADEVYDPEKGLALCICKKVFGNTGAYYKEFKKWLEP